jgi:hypothetical protein
MSLAPTRKITALTVAETPLSGDELLESVQLGNSRQIRTRDLVLPTDSLITVSGMGGSIPGSRQLVSSLSVQLVDGGPGGELSLNVISAVGASTALQSAVLAAGANHDFILGPDPLFPGFLDCSTAAGIAQLTGMIAQFDGQIVTITNLGPNLLTLSALTGSAAANQFRLAANVGLITNSSYTLRYSTSIGKWVPYS